MGPGEVIVALGIVVFLPLSLVSMVLRYKSMKLKQGTGSRGQDSSLTMTELETLMEDAVSRAIDPVSTRLGLVERKLDQMLAPGKEPGPAIRRLESGSPTESPESEPPIEQAEKTVGRLRSR